MRREWRIFFHYIFSLVSSFLLFSLHLQISMCSSETNLFSCQWDHLQRALHLLKTEETSGNAVQEWNLPSIIRIIIAHCHMQISCSVVCFCAIMRQRGAVHARGLRSATETLAVCHDPFSPSTLLRPLHCQSSPFCTFL